MQPRGTNVNATRPNAPAGGGGDTQKQRSNRWQLQQQKRLLQRFVSADMKAKTHRVVRRDDINNWRSESVGNVIPSFPLSALSPHIFHPPAPLLCHSSLICHACWDTYWTEPGRRVPWLPGRPLPWLLVNIAHE